MGKDADDQANKIAAALADHFKEEAESAQAKMQSLTPEEMREILKQKGGVDVDQNDADPMGDGDQRPLQGAQADETRELWSTGGDIFDAIQTGKLSDFAMLCFLGAAKQVASALQECKTKREKKVLLETRQGVLRQTPLMLCIIAIKLEVRGEKEQSDHPGVAKLLLREGCAVNARDVAGHTACFHSSGVSSNETCHQVLRMLVANGGDVNLSNRWGGTSLHESVMGHNLAAVKLLLELGANPDLADSDSCTARTMAQAVPAIMDMIVEATRRREVGKAQVIKCLVCGKDDRAGMQQCSVCKNAWYCSKECQNKDWKRHKKECGEKAL